MNTFKNTYNRREILRLMGMGAMAATALATGCGGGGGGGGGPMGNPNRGAADPVYGLNFGADVKAGQDPFLGSVIPAQQMTTLLTRLQGFTQWIRTYGTEDGLQNVPAIAHQMGFKTAIGAFIGTDSNVNNAEIANLVTAANAGDVDMAIVGNEVLLNGYQTAAQLIAYIQSVKNQVPANVQVTTADTWNTLVANPTVIAAVDVVAANIYPFYENAAIANALAALQSDYAQIVQAAGAKTVIIMETGWPSSGNPPANAPLAVPSATNASTYFSQVETWARGANIPLFYFEAYDEPWKANHGDYPSWGLWDDNGNLKPGMSAVFQ